MNGVRLYVVNRERGAMRPRCPVHGLVRYRASDDGGRARLALSNADPDGFTCVSQTGLI